jgi:hypothetical protein
MARLGGGRRMIGIGVCSVFTIGIMVQLLVIGIYTGNILNDTKT